MALGDAVHSMLHEKFKSAGIVIEYYNPDGSVPKDWNGKEDKEFPVSEQALHIKKGKIDEVVIIDGELWLCEYKSINLNGFSSLLAAKDDHFVQGTIYFYLFNQHLKEGKYSHIKELSGFEKAKGIIYLYVCKDDTNLKEFRYTESDEEFSKIVQKIITVREHYDKKSLPPKTPEWCNSCSWRDKCKKNFNIS